MTASNNNLSELRSIVFLFFFNRRSPLLNKNHIAPSFKTKKGKKKTIDSALHFNSVNNRGRCVIYFFNAPYLEENIFCQFMSLYAEVILF